jgi:eukaryotic-like serine/threonine-protein kinase
MMKSGFWNTDWFLGLAVAVAFVLLAILGGDLMRSVERKAYDLGVLVANRVPADNVTEASRISGASPGLARFTHR